MNKLEKYKLLRDLSREAADDVLELYSWKELLIADEKILAIKKYREENPGISLSVARERIENYSEKFL